jgi:hypothetical protein
MKKPEVKNLATLSLLKSWFARTRLFRLINTQNKALRAPPPPIAAQPMLQSHSVISKKMPLARFMIREIYRGRYEVC